MVGRLCVIALLVGCRATGAFQCESDAQCRHGARPGRCEPIGYCSFPDNHCASGSRFDDNSAPGYADKCVGVFEADAAIDVPPSFDVTTCPAEYTGEVASTKGSSRYKHISDGTAWTLAADCDDDMPGVTHLMTPQTEQELSEVTTWIQSIATMHGNFFAGLVQDPAATMPAEGWLLFDDTPVPMALWRTGDPNDGDGNEVDHAAQAAMFSRFSGLFSDDGGNTRHGGVCECDGKPWGPMSRAYFDADPNNPNP